ncbi:MAG: transposase, partial [Kofleriaceae bacterium]
AMTRPRAVLPNTSAMITRRCTQRQFLLRPDQETNNAYLYCLIEAALKFDVQVVLGQMMSNHKHEEIYDRHGHRVEFCHRFHGHLAKCVNMQRGRWENMWASKPTSVVEPEDREAWIEQLVYVATNPVKANLVEKVEDWPGPPFVHALLNKGTLRATRPRFFRTDGTMPEEVEYSPTIPPELGDPDEIIAELRRRIAAVEEECARKRTRPVLGRDRVLRQSWRDAPKSREERRTMSPRVASRNVDRRIGALTECDMWLDEYQVARSLFVAGLPAVFPPGTYWLARFANVEVRSALQRAPDRAA